MADVGEASITSVGVGPSAGVTLGEGTSGGFEVPVNSAPARGVGVATGLGVGLGAAAGAPFPLNIPVAARIPTTIAATATAAAPQMTR